MKNTIKQVLAYVFNNYIGNFLGFIVGYSSTHLVAYFFTTKSIKNLWGLTAKKTVVDKQTFGMLEWAVSLLIGFIVFEMISKWATKKLEPWMNKLLPQMYNNTTHTPVRGTPDQ